MRAVDCSQGTSMDKVVTILRSFEQADRADKEYYRSLTPEQRLDILCDLNKRLLFNGDDENFNRLERVYRIVKLSQCLPDARRTSLTWTRCRRGTVSPPMADLEQATRS
jgi:hypothetical protein